MAEFSFDIVSEFDFQELRNAIDQTKRETSTRFDLKDSDIEIELNQDAIDLNIASEHQSDAVLGIVIQKIVNRKISPKILDPQKIEASGGMRFRQSIKLIKSLDQENAKKISKFIRDNFPKAKASIQGDTVRISSKSKDDLQAVMNGVKNIGIEVPLQFTNYR